MCTFVYLVNMWLTIKYINIHICIYIYMYIRIDGTFVFATPMLIVWAHPLTSVCCCWLAHFLLSKKLSGNSTPNCVYFFLANNSRCLFHVHMYFVIYFLVICITIYFAYYLYAHFICFLFIYPFTYVCMYVAQMYVNSTLI